MTFSIGWKLAARYAANIPLSLWERDLEEHALLRGKRGLEKHPLLRGKRGLEESSLLDGERGLDRKRGDREIREKGDR